MNSYSCSQAPHSTRDKEIRIRAEYNKVIEQHEQHAAFWSKKCHFQGRSLHLDVSVDGDPTASLDYVHATLAKEFKCWMASDGALEVSSYGKLCGLKACLQLSNAGALSASMVKAEVLHGIASHGLLATVGGIYVAGSVESGGGLAVLGSAAGLVGEVVTSSALGEAVAGSLTLGVSAIETACQAAALDMFLAESAMTAAASLVSEALAVEVTITAAEGMFATLTAGLSYALMPVPRRPGWSQNSAAQRGF